MLSPRHILALALALVCLTPRPARAQGGPPAPGSMDLPRSATSLAAAMGLDPSTPRARLMLEVIRQVHPALPAQCRECDAARQRLAEWVSAGPSAADEGDRRVPSPWSEGTWRSLLGERAPSSSLAAAILADRQAALLYHGLVSLDPATCAYLEARPKLRERLYERQAASFAVFGRSLPVREGRIVLPGGARELALWEDLVGERASDPEAFIPAALGKAAGRFAYFLDTVAHLDPARQAFALASSEPDRGTRERRVRELLEAFVDVQPEWRIADRPFSRPLSDPALALLVIAATPEGRFAAPGGRGFWEGVFRDAPPGPEGDEAERELPPVDAAWIVSRTVMPDLATSRERLAAVSFVQRVFGQAQRPQLAAAVRAGRAFIAYRAAMVAVERVGATDPLPFARMADLADGLTAAGHVEATAPLQAALALLVRLRERAALSRDQALRLLDSLIALQTNREGRYHGAVTTWVEAQLLPALGAPAATGDLEGALVGALAGRRPDAAPDPGAPRPGSSPVKWEGVDYRVDVAAAERARLERVRDRQPGNRLDAGLDLARRARAVAGARTPAELQIACARVVALGAALAPVPWPAPGTGATLVPPGELIVERCEDLKGVSAPGELSGASVKRRLSDLVDIADAVVSDTLVSIVYALHAGDPAGAIDLAPDLARRHRFATSDRVGQGNGVPAWSLPRERVGAGTTWHVEGALLGLEHALASLSLRFLSGQQMPEAPRLNLNERATLALGLALLNPYALHDDGRDAMVGALARGRERLRTPAQVGEELDRLGGQLGWSEWRRESIRWAVAHTPLDLPRLLTLADCFWAGKDAGRAVPLDAWGPATTPVDGDLRQAWPVPRPWEELAGRSANGQLTTRFVDLVLRVAETLAQHRLPAALAPAILAPALADLIHEAPLGHADDWYALGSYVLNVPEDRMLDYIASLAAGGPLVPAIE